MNDTRKVTYAVVGLGHIAQVAVLPAFAHALENSTLTALVSGDADKLAALGARYGVPYTFDYDQYDECLELVDAVYIALPNSMHAEYAIRAARAGVHVLCEKPMAVTVDECEQMITAAHDHGVRLMVAYRLHFEHVNLDAITLVNDAAILRFEGERVASFAPELIYFSRCVLDGIDPEPSGEEGLQDVRIINALYESADAGKPIQLPPYQPAARPDSSQQIRRPPVSKPEVINAPAPHS